MQSAARRWYENAAALRAGRITAEEARANNAALRAEIGDAAYEQARVVAMANAHRIGL
jgi:hypothetical protein